jgi:mannose-6-phosphate isomerase-like protein (cupin superfamily)
MFNTKPLSADVDVLAPDMSEIRVLLSVEGASMAHGTLSPGCVSLTIRHRTVEEIWYIVGGEGEIWRKHGDREEIVRLRAGICITIPVGTIFQFRTIGDRPLRFIMCTIPPWPGPDEAIREPDHWPVENV